MLVLARADGEVTSINTATIDIATNTMRMLHLHLCPLVQLSSWHPLSSLLHIKRAYVERDEMTICHLTAITITPSSRYTNLFKESLSLPISRKARRV